MTEPTIRSCQICKCTNEHPCAGGCSWAADGIDVCDRCLPKAVEAALIRLHNDKSKITIEAPRSVLFAVTQMVQTLYNAGVQTGQKPSEITLMAAEFSRRLQEIAAKNEPLVQLVCCSAWLDPNPGPQILTPDRRIITPP